MHKKTPRKARLPLLLALSLAGCSEALGFGDNYSVPGPDGGSACLPGATKECSPEASGVCLGGFQVCKQDGTGYDACIATTAPPPAGCTCTPGAAVPCYDGLPETLGAGACAAGKKTCGESGKAFGACEGQVLCAGKFGWGKIYGDLEGQEGTAVAADGQGNVIVVGWVTGTVDFGGVVTPPAVPKGVDNDIFILKLDPEGKRLWVKRMGDASPQVANAVAIDPKGNIVVAGYAGGTVDFGDKVPVPPVDPASDPASVDVFVIELDPDGKLLWKHRAGGVVDQVADAVAVDDQGNVVIAGHFAGALSFDPMAMYTSAGLSDIFIAKFDPLGTYLWSKPFGSAANDVAYGVAFDAHGNVIVTGSVQGTVDFDGMVTMPAAMNGTDSDVFVLKLDAGGKLGWVRRYGDALAQSGTGIAADPKDDSVVITGEFGSTLDFKSTTLTSAGLTDIFLARLDSSGEVTFAKAYGDDQAAQGGRGVAIDSHGNIVLVADVIGAVNFGADPGTLLTSAGNADIAVAKLDSTGHHLWSKLFGNANTQFCNGVAVDAQGDVLLTGAVAGAVNFGGGLLPSAGAGDLVVAKLSP